MENGSTAIENNWWFLKKLNVELLYNSTIPLLGIHWKTKIENRCSNMYMHTYVRSCEIHSSQKVKTAQMSITEWMDKQIIQLSNEILFSH